jgi:hypothetical protein
LRGRRHGARKDRGAGALKVIDNNGAFVLPQAADFLMKETKEVGVVHLHPIQRLAILNALPIKVIVLDRPEGSAIKGVRFVEDIHFPKDQIDLEDEKGNVLMRLKNLAVPKPGLS